MSRIEIKQRILALMDKTDEPTLVAIEQLLIKSEADFWDATEIAALNSDIEISEAQIKSGDTYTHQEVINLSNKWQHTGK